MTAVPHNSGYAKLCYLITKPGDGYAARPNVGWSKKVYFLGFKNSGPDRDRTDDLLRAKQALSQLSYGPQWLVLVPSGNSGSRSIRLIGVLSGRTKIRTWDLIVISDAL